MNTKATWSIVYDFVSWRK